MYIDNPTIIWSYLRNQVKQSIETHIYQLTYDTAITFQDTDSVSTFYTKLKTLDLGSELDGYGEILHCDYAELMIGKTRSNLRNLSWVWMTNSDKLDPTSSHMMHFPRCTKFIR